MGSNKQGLLFGLYVILGILMESFFLWLFPNTGLGGLICWPTAIVLSIGFGAIILGLPKGKIPNWLVGVVFLTLLSIQGVIQLATMPQDYGGDTFSKIADAQDAYSRYDQIEFEDFPHLTTNERVVYIHKFKDSLPESIISLKIDSVKNGYESMNPRTYLIQDIDGKRIYDETKINIVESDSGVVITEYYQGIDTLVYKMYGRFGAFGYHNGIISIDVDEDDLEFDSGIEKSLYFILRLTKPG